MKGLYQFVKFDCNGFLCGKTLQAVSCGPLNDYSTKEHIGTKIGIVITADDTVYELKNGEMCSNIYERFNVKVIGKDLTLVPGTVVSLVNPRGTVYGEYRNMLSVVADDIQAVTNGKE